LKFPIKMQGKGTVDKVHFKNAGKDTTSVKSDMIHRQMRTVKKSMRTVKKSRQVANTAL